MRRLPIESLVAVSLLMTACDAGALFSDREAGTISISSGGDSLESGTANFPIGNDLSVLFSRSLLFSSVSTESAYIVLESSGFGEEVEGTSFDSQLCLTANQIASIIGYNDRTLTIAPESDLLCGQRYALCLTTGLLFEEDLPFEGATILFDTQECVPALANATTVNALTSQAITPIDFANSGGATSSCDVSPALPSGFNLLVYNGSCRITGTPTASNPQTTYTVTATNLSGSATADVIIEILEYPPNEPSGLTFVSATNSTINLSWTSGGGTTSGFYIKHATGSSAPADCTTPDLTVGNVASTSVGSLSAGTEYSFRLCSINANSTPDVSAGTTLTSQWTLPNNVVMSSAGLADTSITLNWSAASGATSYAVKYASGATAPTDCSSPNYTTAGTSQIVSGLVEGAAYSFRVCSINGHADSSTGTTSTEYTLPADVVLGTTYTEPTRITLTWSSSAGAATYKAVRASGAVAPATCNLGTTVFQGSPTFTINSGLSIGTQYSYRICALNSHGDLSAGVTTTAWTEASNPAIGSVTSDETSITLNWGTASGAATYRVAQATGSTAPDDCSTAVATTASTTATISSLSGGTQYSFLICSVNGGGSYSSGVGVTKWTLPNVPSGLGGSSSNTTSIDLSWTAGAGANNGFYIKYAAGGTAPASCASPTTTSAANVTTKNISGLTAGQYSFRVCQVNGNSPVDVSAGITLTYWTLPTDPVTFTVAAASTSQLNLSWTAGSGSNNGWYIKRAAGATAPANCDTPDLTLASGTLSVNDTGLTAGQYSYRLCAVNGNTTPDQSAGLTQTWWTYPQDPINFAVDSSASTTITVSWTPVGVANNYYLRSVVYPGFLGSNQPADCLTSINNASATSPANFIGLSASQAYNLRICAINGNSPPDFSAGVLLENVSTTAMLMGPSGLMFAPSGDGSSQMQISFDQSELLLSTEDERSFSRFSRNQETGALSFKSSETFPSKENAIADFGRFFPWNAKTPSEKFINARPSELLAPQSLVRENESYIVGLNPSRDGISAMKKRSSDSWKLAEEWNSTSSAPNVPQFLRGLKNTKSIAISQDQRFVYVLGENGKAISAFRVLPSEPTSSHK